jgi:hypothetical protein
MEVVFTDSQVIKFKINMLDSDIVYFVGLVMFALVGIAIWIAKD